MESILGRFVYEIYKNFYLLDFGREYLKWILMLLKFLFWKS